MPQILEYAQRYSPVIQHSLYSQFDNNLLHLVVIIIRLHSSLIPVTRDSSSTCAVQVNMTFRPAPEMSVTLFMDAPKNLVTHKNNS
jgi:hypothetical protein